MVDSDRDNLNPAEAFMALAVIAVNIDGEQALVEELVLSGALSEMELFAHYEVEQLTRLVERVYQKLEIEGKDVLMGSAIAALPIDLHESLIYVARQIIIADGKISPEEEDLLQELIKALELDMRS